MPGYDVLAIPVYETVAIYACVPLAVVLFFAALTLGPALRGRSRWKSGQPWEHEPVWFEPHPEHEEALGHAEGHVGAQPADVHRGGTNTSALPLGGVRTGAEHGGVEPAALASGSGASAAGTAARPAGPLGGARGTW